MAVKTDAELLAQAVVIRDENAEGANTATRVGTMVVDIIDSKGNKGSGASIVMGAGYDASTTVFPSVGGTGSSGTIQKANSFNIDVAGTIAGVFLPKGTTIQARQDNPTSDWDEVTGWKYY